MKKYTIQEALKIIIDASEEYEKKLNDKHFLIIYQTGKEIKTTEVGFRDINFLHLTESPQNYLHPCSILLVFRTNYPLKTFRLT